MKDWLLGCTKLKLFYKLSLVAAVLVLQGASASGAVKVRYYPGGEADDGAVVGGVALSTEDILEPPSEDVDGNAIFDSAGDFVLLEALTEDMAPTYVEGRDGGLALLFDGVNDELRSAAFDPRNFRVPPSFTALSQAWVKPSAAGSGRTQAIWSLGTDNGGAGITDSGQWVLQSSAIPDQVSPIDVVFDEWSHLAVIRGGNSATLYVNGELAIRGEGFWNGTNEVVLGNSFNEAGAFAGAIDDFNIAGFSDGTFDTAVDLDFTIGPEPTGIAGDVDQDGDADADDYAIWSANVGFDNAQGAGDITTLLKGDLDGNGRINFFDFQEIATAAAAAGAPLVGVPEPSSLGLATLGMLALIGRFRRNV